MLIISKLRQAVGLAIVLLMALISNPVVAGSSQSKEKWVAPKSADAVVNPLKGDVAATKEGKYTYFQLCVICHGDLGKGDGFAGISLNPKPGNFTSEAVQSQTDGAIYWKLTEGRSPMASYKTLLTDKQRWQLVNYIRTMKKK